MWCYTLLPKIWNMSLNAGVIILVVLLARLALKRAPKVFSYALWAVVLFRLLCPVSLPSGLSLFSLVNAPVSGQNTLEYIPPDIVHTEDPEVDLPLPGVSAAVNQALPYGDEQLAADPLEAPMAIATTVWLFGIAVPVIYSVVSLLRLRRKLVGSALLRDNIRLADQISSPFVMGLFRPKIYLPSSLPGSERDYIILHEQTHIRRGDHIVKLLAFAALCIHWFNPLVWAAFILSGKDMEMSCDEAVLRTLGGGIRSEYSQSLLNLATGRRVIGGTPLAFGEGNTKSRIKNALKWKKPAVWIVIVAVLVCAAVILVCALNPKVEEEPTLEPFENSYSVEETIHADNPKAEEEPAPEPFGNSYRVEETIYADGRFSFVMIPESAPIYHFTEDYELLYWEKESSDQESGGWNTVGGLTEVKLTKSTFDAYFHETGIGIWTDGYSAAALRRDNQKAWQNLSQEGGFSYYLLLQKNGEVFLAYWHNGENGENESLSDDSYVRFLLKLTKTEIFQDNAPMGGADGPTDVSVEADPLDTAVSAALWDFVKQQSFYESNSAWFWCESHVILGTLSGAAESGENAEQLTAYAVAAYKAYDISDQGLTVQWSWTIPAAAVTFTVTDGDTYTLMDFCVPRDGAFYEEDVREQMPRSLWEDVCDIQKREEYSLALDQACYAQAVEHSGVDPNAAIERLFKTIEASPAWSSNPGDYINAHDTEHRELLCYGDYTLQYIFRQFFAGGQTGLKGHLMRIVMEELIGGEAIDLGTDTGQEYFDAWLAAIRNTRAEQGDAYVREHMPKAWMLLEMVDSITSISKPPAD